MNQHTCANPNVETQKYEKVSIIPTKVNNFTVMDTNNSEEDEIPNTEKKIVRMVDEIEEA
jgi:hypothetical protein